MPGFFERKFLGKSMRRYLHNFLAVLVLLITTAGAVAAQSQPDESTTSTGEISGQVVNDSGQPMPNAVVAVRAFGAGGPGRTTTTDSEGSFQMKGLEPVAYVITVVLAGYVMTPRDPDRNPAAYYHLGDVARIEMSKGGVITGTVTRSAGEPVVVVPVRAYMIRDGNGRPSRYGSPFREVTTDDRGIYRVYGLPSGTYVVSAGGGRPSPYEVSAFGSDVPTYAPSSPRDAAAEVSVRAGEESANVDIRYRGEPGHVVSGMANTPVASDQPPGFSITLMATFNGIAQPSYSSFQNPGGRGFAISGVADGDYDAIAQSYFPGAGEWLISDARRIKVRGADINGIELTAKPLGAITGRVVLEESKVPECKDKRRLLLRETVLSSWHNEKIPTDQPPFVWGLGAPVLPDPQGEFHLHSLAPGQYRFNVPPTAKYWYLKSISWPSVAGAKAAPANRPVDAARNWTTLKPGDRLSGLIITMALGAASLRGQIEIAAGQKLPPRLFVYLVPAEPEKADDVLRFFTAPVEADGSFALNHLAPGRYWPLAQTANESDVSVLSKLRLPDEAEARAKVRHDAESTKIETALQPCQNLTGYRLPLKPATPGQ
jgi:hypothetical protein